jgi:hypothetical protein
VTDLIDIDVRLLVLRYGRTKVLQALAHQGEQTFEDLERQLQQIAQKPKPKRAQPAIMDLVASQAQERPEIAEPLRAIAVRFENRTFLPQLRDVQRFLDRSGVTHGKLKSRAAAAPLLIRALTTLPPDDLARLIAPDQAGNDSDYALLARAIMGTSKSPNTTEK